MGEFVVGDAKDIEFTGKILDNVHGYIYYTKAESDIMNTLLFKRLQSIKQLSLANWIFPGSEHTRFIHSLGVMHISDRMAKQIKLTEGERKIVRLAGLLHDIGHYPLSHVCEFPYKKGLETFSDEKFCSQVNEKAKESIDCFHLPIEVEFMKTSKQGHHESVGALIIRNEPTIQKIIMEECGEEAIDIICDMITGNVTRNTTDPILVQILHSELDADGIDYMLRDAKFSGTSFGSFELDLLISCMTKSEYKGSNVLSITPEGISAADQYIINKFFSYSQVVYDKRISAVEWMAERVVDWMQKNDSYFPSKSELLKNWISIDSDFSKYLKFNDNYFWTSIKDIIDSPVKKLIPKYIIELCTRLLNHDELIYIEDSEIRIISSDESQIKKILQDSMIYKEIIQNKDQIVIHSVRSMTKTVPVQLYEKSLEKCSKQNEPDDAEDKEYIDIFKEERLKQRLMEGICVCDDGDLHLLCDDNRSLMQHLYSVNIVLMRAFKFDIST